MKSTILNILQIAAIYLSALFILPIQGCVNDDLSVCGIKVNFVFTKNVEGIDKFATNVDKINLFIYDSAGNYVGEYLEEGTRLHTNGMNLNLMEGTYSLVAWGNLCDDYDLTNKSTLQDAILSLKRTTDNTIDTHPGDLYHGGLYQINVMPGFQNDQVFTIELTKNTNNIKVRSIGMPYDETGESALYDFSIVSKNGDYSFENTIIGTDRLQYIPESIITEEKEKESDFVIMRELNSNITNSSIIITRTEKDKAPINVVEEDLVPILIPASITGDLDIDDTFEIELEIRETNGTTTILINGWVVYYTGGHV